MLVFVVHELLVFQTVKVLVCAWDRTRVKQSRKVSYCLKLERTFVWNHLQRIQTLLNDLLYLLFTHLVLLRILYLLKPRLNPNESPQSCVVENLLIDRLSKCYHWYISSSWGTKNVLRRFASCNMWNLGVWVSDLFEVLLFWSPIPLAIYILVSEILCLPNLFDTAAIIIKCKKL